ncbi:MAG TPA: NAD-binding protein, partial [Chitinophagaceae bacterium]
NLDGSYLLSIKKHINYLDTISIPSSIYPFLKDTSVTIRTLGVWSFLIGRQSAIAMIKRNDKGNFIDALFASPSFNDTDAAYIAPCYKNNNFSLNTDDGHFYISFRGKQTIDEFTKGIPICKDLTAALGIKSSGFLFFLLTLGILAALSLWFFTQKKIIRVTIAKKITPSVIIGLGIIGIAVAIYAVIFGSENWYLRQYGVMSPLLNLSFKDRVLWYVRLMFDPVTETFPASDIGKVLMSVTHHIWVVFTVGILLFHQSFKSKNRKKMEGTAIVQFKNHYVFCGWNTKSSELIQLLIKGSLDEKHDEKLNNKIVVISPGMKKIVHSDQKLKEYYQCNSLWYVEGDAKDSATLAKANISMASSIIFLAENSSKESDESTIMRAFVVNNHLKKSIDQIPYRIAELNEAEHAENLKDLGVNEVVCQNTIMNSLILHSSLNPGLFQVIEDLLTFNDNNEFYTMNLKEDKFEQFRIKNFDELLRDLRNYNIQLIAILKGGSTKDFILNPKNDMVYKTTSHDKLLVVALDKSSLDIEIDKPLPHKAKTLAELEEAVS